MYARAHAPRSGSGGGALTGMAPTGMARTGMAPTGMGPAGRMAVGMELLVPADWYACRHARALSFFSSFQSFIVGMHSSDAAPQNHP